MKDFENLNVWKESRQLVKDVYILMKNCKDYSLKDQIQRASVSVINNIAEGAESGSDMQHIRYLNISKASCAEVRSMFYLCEDIGACSPEEAKLFRDKTKIVITGIQKLINYLQSSNAKH
ncbi:MAG: four helix bundle protein [Paludibacter sp.]|nr:four helix bundle protein [Paludibacter sp.]